MDIAILSDTHSKHAGFTKWLAGGGDVLVCCGDVTGNGEETELKKFADWLQKQPFTHKIVVAGNHDTIFEQSPSLSKKILKEKNIIYLENSEVVIEGIKFYGSPVIPVFLNRAFNKQRGAEIRSYWDKIPTDTDVLITHCPPYGILDKTIDGYQAGCKDLLKKVYAIKPKVHCFGHIHEGYGFVCKDDICFINSCLLNHHFKPANRPHIITL